MPLQSSLFLTGTPQDKRRRLSQGLDLRSNWAFEFETPFRRGRHKKRKRALINVVFLLCLHLSCPQSYNQALQSPDVSAWKASIAAEVHTLQNMRKCWEVVPYPPGQHNYLRCHFVFKIKMKEGKVDRYKSRLVVDGSKQVSGQDFSDSFAPVVNTPQCVSFLQLLLFTWCMFTNLTLRVLSYMHLCMKLYKFYIYASTPWNACSTWPLC